MAAQAVLAGVADATPKSGDGEVEMIRMLKSAKLDFMQNPGKVMDEITFVRSHWWLVSEGFHYRPPTPMYRNSPPLCTIVLQIPSLMPLKMRKVQPRTQLSRLAPRLSTR